MTLRWFWCNRGSLTQTGNPTAAMCSQTCRGTASCGWSGGDCGANMSDELTGGSELPAASFVQPFIGLIALEQSRLLLQALSPERLPVPPLVLPSNSPNPPPASSHRGCLFHKLLICFKWQILWKRKTLAGSRPSLGGPLKLPLALVLRAIVPERLEAQRNLHVISHERLWRRPSHAVCWKSCAIRV